MSEPGSPKFTEPTPEPKAERIASREAHNSRLFKIGDSLKTSGFLENVTFTFPDADKVSALQGKEKWLSGAGDYVTVATVTYNAGPKTEGQDNSDQFHRALLEDGYVVDVWLDYETEELSYHIYEKSEISS